jgi:flagellar motility protein MotE (MotC chaperone)
MKKMIMIGVYGLLILGVSAGGTWFLRQKDMAAQEALDTKAAANDPPVSDLAAHVDVTTPLPPKRDDEELPVAVRPGEMSVEEIVRYGLGLKAREAAIRQREDALRRTETQHRMVLADIDGEQKEIEGLLAQARDQRTAAEQLLGQAQKERMDSEKVMKEMEDKKKKMEIERQKTTSKKPSATAVGETEVDRDANIKELVSVMAGMSPEASAGVMREFANDGKMDMAVEILSKLEERKAAGILDAMADEKLVSEIASRFLELKRPVKL